MTNEHFDINTLTIRVYERVMTDAERLRFRPRKGDERMIGTEIKSGDGVCLLSREFVFDRVASANLQVMTRQTALFGLADLWHLGRVHFVHAPPPHPSALGLIFDDHVPLPYDVRARNTEPVDDAERAFLGLRVGPDGKPLAKTAGGEGDE